MSHPPLHPDINSISINDLQLDFKYEYGDINISAKPAIPSNQGL